MKKLIIAILLLFQILPVSAKWNFEDGAKYIIKIACYTDRYVCVGVEHDLSVPVACITTSPSSEDFYWYIQGNDQDGYTFQNALTMQYLSWSEDYSSDRYLNYADEDEGPDTRWQIEHSEDGYSVVRNMGNVDYIFNVRESRDQLGTYANNTGGSSNEQCYFYDENGQSAWTNDGTIDPGEENNGSFLFPDWQSDNQFQPNTQSTHSISFQCNEGALITFDYLVSSEKSFDALTITLDGSKILAISGEQSGHYESSPLVEGTHTLVFVYRKDGSGDSGDDMATVTNIVVSNPEKPNREDFVKPTTIVNDKFAENTTWYRMSIRSGKWVYTSGTGIYCDSYYDPQDPACFWCFTVDEDNLYHVYNMATGPIRSMTVNSSGDGEYVTMNANGTYQGFDLTENSNGGFNIQLPAANACANDHGLSGILRLWDSSNAPSDYGSNIVIEEVEDAYFVAMEQIFLDDDALNLYEDDEIDMGYSYLPSNATVTHVIWTSEDESIASVSRFGVVRGMGNGQTTIRATSTLSPEVYDECQVTVIGKVRVSSIEVPQTLTLRLGQCTMLPVTVYPSDAFDTSCHLTSSDEDIVSVVGASQLQANAEGTVTITVFANDDGGVTATCQITVIDPESGTKIAHGDDYLFLQFGDGGLIAIAQDLLRGEYQYEGTRFCAMLSDGETVVYDDVVDVLDHCPYELPAFTSFKFNNKFNYQLFSDIVAPDPAADEINLSIGAIGKRLTPSFQLPDADVRVWVDGQLQESKSSRLRFDHPVTYIIGYEHWRQLELIERGDGSVDYLFEPFGKKTTVSVDWLTDHFTSAVPEIHINTLNEANIVSKTEYLDATLEIKGGGVFPDMSATSMMIKGRGNTSWGGYGSKNPYRLKFPSKVKPFGMPKGKNWILLANKQSGSMTTNAIGQKIASLMDSDSPACILPVELYINGTYQGSYNFCQKIGLSGNSIDLTDDTRSAILELDTYGDEGKTTSYSNAYSIPTKINDPDVEEADYVGPLTYDGIISDYDRMMYHLSLGDGSYVNYVDVPSLARFLATCDLMMNQEFQHPKSVFIHSYDVTDDIDLTGRDTTAWRFGPLWDCDWGFGYEGSRTYFQHSSTDNFFEDCIGYGSPHSFWNALRYQAPEVDMEYYKVWDKFMNDGGLTELMEFCDDYYAFAQRSLSHNSDGQFAFDSSDYAQVTCNCKTWLKQRARYVYSNINHYALSAPILQKGDVNGDGQFTIADMTLLVGILLGQQVDRYSTADINGDGRVNFMDTHLLSKKILSLHP